MSTMSKEIKLLSGNSHPSFAGPAAQLAANRLVSMAIATRYQPTLVHSHGFLMEPTLA